jgi:hypothetical protein
MLEIIGLLIVLLVIGFAVTYIPGDPAIKRLVVGIVILIAVIIVVLWILQAFGVIGHVRLFS